MPESYPLFPVGRIRSAITDPAAAPHQGRESGTEAFVEIFDAYADALDGIEQFDRVIVLCWFHRSRRDLLQVHPRGDEANPLRGVFATRSPLRPNPIAVYTARLLERSGTTLKLRGIDAVDGTPVIDIKPYLSYSDSIADAKGGYAATAPERPFEVIFSDEPMDNPPTRAVIGDDTCYRQIEFVGILKGTNNRDFAEIFIDFMLSPTYQEDIPLQMYVFPVNQKAQLDEIFLTHLEIPDKPVMLEPAEIALNREKWIKSWTNTVLR